MDLDDLRRQAEKLLDDHGDEVTKAIDKAEELAKGRVSGHDSQIDQVADRLRGLVEDHDDKSGGSPPAAKAPGKPRPAAKTPGKQSGGKQGGRPAAKQPRRPGR